MDIERKYFENDLVCAMIQILFSEEELRYQSIVLKSGKILEQK